MGRLSVVSFEGILCSYLALVRLALLLPFKTMENATSGSNDVLDKPVAFLEGAFNSTGLS
jgi:hypothetical protein